MSSIAVSSSTAIQTAAPVKPKAKKSKIVLLCKKIWMVAVQIFLTIYNFFRNLFKRSSTLSQSEMDVFDKFVKMDTLPQHHAIEIARKNDLSSGKAMKIQDEKTQKDLPSLKVTPARKTVQDFSQDCTALIGDLVYAKQVEPLLKKVQAYGAPVASGLKEAVSLALPVIGHGSRASQDLSQLPQWRQSVRRSLTGPIKLLEGSSEEIIKNLQNVDISDDGNKYVDMTLDWIISMKKTPKKKQAEQEGIASVVTGKVYETLQIVMDKKLEKWLDNANALLNDLPGIVQQSMDVHLEKFSNILSNRIVDLLEQVSFSDTIDKVVSVVTSHSSSFLEAEKTVTKKLQDAAVKKEKTASKEELLFKEFSNYNACHRHIRKFVYHHRDDLHNSQAFDELLLKDFYLPLSKKIIKLILPNGLEPIIKEGELPEGLQNLLNEIKEIGSHVFNPKLVEGFTSIKGTVIDLLKRTFFGFAETELENRMVLVLKNQFEKMINPMRLNELMARTILPSLTDVRLGSFVWGTVQKHIEELAPTFHKAIKNPEPSADLTKIKNSTMGFVIADFSQFKLKESGMTKTDIEAHVNPLVNDLYRFLVFGVEEIVKKKKREKIDDDVIAEYLKKYFAYKEKKYSDVEHKLYWDMFETLIFKVGQFGSSAETLVNQWKSSISYSLLYSADIARSSYEGLTVLICDSVRRNYVNKREAMDNALFGEEEEPQSDEAIKRKLAGAIDSFGRIMYDRVMQSIEAEGGRMGWVATYAATPFLGKDASHFTKLISRIYEKTLGMHKIFSASLLCNVTDIFAEALQNAARKCDNLEQERLSVVTL